MTAKKRSPAAKPTVKKRTLNPPGGGKRRPSQGAPFSEQDVKRRLGNYTTAGEHARMGGRTSGVVGQTKRRFTTDKAKIKGK